MTTRKPKRKPSPTFRGVPIRYEKPIRTLHPKRKPKTGKHLIWVDEDVLRRLMQNSPAGLIAAARKWRKSHVWSEHPELIDAIDRYEDALAKRRSKKP